MTQSKILIEVEDVNTNQEALEILIPENIHLCKPQSDLDYVYNIWKEIRKQFRL